jgi:hypothetical protein
MNKKKGRRLDLEGKNDISESQQNCGKNEMHIILIGIDISCTRNKLDNRDHSHQIELKQK